MSSSTTTARSSATAVSVHVPRLADFTRSDKSALISKSVIRACVRGADAALAMATGLAIAALYVNEAFLGNGPSYLAAAVWAAMLTVGVFEVLGLYKTERFVSILTQMPRVVFGWAIVFVALLATMFFLKSGIAYSRVWLAVWFALGGVALIGGRLFLAAMARSWQRSGRMFRRAVVYGSGDVARKVLADLESDLDSDIRICGVFDERHDERVPKLLTGYPMLGGVDDLLSFARQTRIDVVIVALPIVAEVRIDYLVKKLAQFNAAVMLPASATKMRLDPRAYSRIGNVAMIDLMKKPITDWGLVAKWVFDKTVALAALVLLAPVMLAVAAAIRLDSKGPIFFKQKRYGLNNELIEMFKFRSMYTEMSDVNAAKLVTKDDPRVTPIGRFIRKTSLDELPQLFNVLRGDLSLVGPRPHALQAKAGDKLYDEVVEGYFSRHRVTPGITGWAQINGWRGETDTSHKIQKRVDHDIYYIENWSILLDMYILLKTPFALLKTDNAY